ncbi:hypothetical protein Taro_041218 [Colocasia esculenta]|uniref:DNA (cytosine-5-)-methyltransferase n=1 Tax=Colocasia esculenta TaxID=4460 RepID=A0A843WF78_COLES|nr:hypothetical protein [Colocasia esculenta]
MAVVTYGPLVVANHARFRYLAIPIVFGNFPVVVGSPFFLGVVPGVEDEVATSAFATTQRVWSSVPSTGQVFSVNQISTDVAPAQQGQCRHHHNGVRPVVTSCQSNASIQGGHRQGREVTKLAATTSLSGKIVIVGNLRIRLDGGDPLMTWDRHLPTISTSNYFEFLWHDREDGTCIIAFKQCWSEDSSNNSCQSQNERRCLDHSTEECRSYFSATKLEETATENSNIDAYGEVQTGKTAEYVSVYDKTEGCSKRSFSATGMGQDMISSLEDVYDYKEVQSEKKAKCASGYDKSSICCNIKEARIPKLEDEHQEMPGSFKNFSDFPAGSHRINKHEQCNLGQSGHQSMSKPPFFFYGNVVDVSQGTWKKLSHFLYGIEPEHVNSRFFSAFIRDEGYFHNLPKENRFHIIPKPPMTIEDALPRTKKWWPSWDTRRQFSCISLDTVGVPHICKRLEKMLMDSHGMLSKEQQMDALHQCKTLNLVWVGEHRLSPIEPSQIEQILGYPVQHTQIQGLELIDRLRALKCSFQTDALGYHVSVLKQMFPSGLRVVSIFSGIGGAEVALHRLGIRLKCVISVEASEVNRRILKRWWQNTGQSGELLQIEGIEKLTSKKVETLVEQFGGFDIVIGGSPCTCTYRGPSSGRSVGLDMNVFFEYVRVLRTTVVVHVHFVNLTSCTKQR